MAHKYKPRTAEPLVQLSIRLPSTVAGRLGAVAAAKNVSLSSLIVSILDAASAGWPGGGE